MIDLNDFIPVPVEGKDLDSWASLTGHKRLVVDDGREPDMITGLPLETDEEYRARILKDVLK